MALRNIPAELKTALNNRDPLTTYHLIKFEKPSNLPFEATNANHYVYLTDAPYAVTYEGNEYLPGSTIKVGKVPETIEAKATTLSLQLSAVKLNKQQASISVSNSTIAAGGTGTLTVDVDLFKSGFYPGDEVVFTKSNNTSFRVRIDKLHGSGTKIDVTNMTIDSNNNEVAISFNSNQNCSV